MLLPPETRSGKYRELKARPYGYYGTMVTDFGNGMRMTGVDPFAADGDFFGVVFEHILGFVGPVGQGHAAARMVGVTTIVYWNHKGPFRSQNVSLIQRSRDRCTVMIRDLNLANSLRSISIEPGRIL